MKRLAVNLASNPVEQRQWLRRVTLIAGAAALVLSLAHAGVAAMLWQTPEPEATDTEALRELRIWAAEAGDIVAGADPLAARRMAVSVGLANAMIRQHLFPWGGLFQMLEETLPNEVRLEIVTPLATVDGVQLTLTAASASEDALLQFLRSLEQRPELAAVLPGRQMLAVDGELRLSIEAMARVNERVVATPESGR